MSLVSPLYFIPHRSYQHMLAPDAPPDHACDTTQTSTSFYLIDIGARIERFHHPHACEIAQTPPMWVGSSYARAALPLQVSVRLGTIGLKNNPALHAVWASRRWVLLTPLLADICHNRLRWARWC